MGESGWTMDQGRLHVLDIESELERRLIYCNAQTQLTLIVTVTDKPINRGDRVAG